MQALFYYHRQKNFLCEASLGSLRSQRNYYHLKISQKIVS
jgi:hypothetical protein